MIRRAKTISRLCLFFIVIALSIIAIYFKVYKPLPLLSRAGKVYVDNVTVGMSRKEVITVLGKPTLDQNRSMFWPQSGTHATFDPAGSLIEVTGAVLSQKGLLTSVGDSADTAETVLGQPDFVQTGSNSVPDTWNYTLGTSNLAIMVMKGSSFRKPYVVSVAIK